MASTTTATAAPAAAASAASVATPAPTTTIPGATGTKIVQAMKSRPWTALGMTVVGLSYTYRQYKAEQKRLDDAKKKKVLVLPFYRMKIVEEKKSPYASLPGAMSSLLEGMIGLGPFAGTAGPGNSTKTIEMPIDEVVTLIHEAAQDPGIVGLYGVFGKGGGINSGWAHLEEIRNALTVFETSHRHHHEPSVDVAAGVLEGAEKDTQESSSDDNNNNKRSKFMYVYTDTFASPQSSMKDYYLASAFSKIHMQQNGDLNLFGLHSTTTFFKDFLQKYGINVHVWKHGEYKNAGTSRLVVVFSGHK
jgi:hypothetical protein